MGWKWMGLYQMGPASQWVESAWDGSEWEAPLRNSLTLHKLIFWAMVPAVFQFTMTCLQTLTPFTLTLGKGGLGWSRHTSVKLTGRIDQPCSCPWMGTGGPDRVALAKGSFTVSGMAMGRLVPLLFCLGPGCNDLLSCGSLGMWITPESHPCSACLWTLTVMVTTKCHLQSHLPQGTQSPDCQSDKL